MIIPIHLFIHKLEADVIENRHRHNTIDMIHSMTYIFLFIFCCGGCFVFVFSFYFQPNGICRSSSRWLNCIFAYIFFLFFSCICSGQMIRWQLSCVFIILNCLCLGRFCWIVNCAVEAIDCFRKPIWKFGFPLKCDENEKTKIIFTKTTFLCPSVQWVRPKFFHLDIYVYNIHNIISIDISEKVIDIHIASIKWLTKWNKQAFSLWLHGPNKWPWLFVTSRTKCTRFQMDFSHSKY